MNIWKLIAHHESPDAAVAWSIKNGRIAVGYGVIGDLRKLQCTAPQDIAARIKPHEPNPTKAANAGRSLWNFFHMQVDDLVILVARKRRRGVVKVTGPYVWTSTENSFERGDYQHQRSAVKTNDDPNELWTSVGANVAPRQSTRWTVARCSIDPSAGTATAEPLRYSEGSQFDVILSKVERNREARLACIAHHGCRCAACDIDFADRYGEDLGHGFIHVHHLRPLADATVEREVDPASDLIPLCPNCHAMVHRSRTILTVEELKARLRCQ